MIILGIDPGSSVTGYGAINYEDRVCQIVECGCVRTSSRLPFAERLRRIYLELTEKIAEIGPDEVAVEDVFYSKDVKAALKIGHARGVILLAAANLGLTISEYSPAEVKRAVAGSGAAPKEQVQFKIKSMLKLSELPQPLDASDAVAVALCHIHTLDIRRRIETADRRQGRR